MAELTAQQKRFVAEYLSDRNATQAAIRAGYSAHTARVQASKLLHKVDIQALVNKVDALAVAQSAVTVERVVAEAAKLAFLNPQDFYDTEGNLLAVTDMPEDAARALAGMEVEQLFERDEDGKMVPSGVLRKIKFAAKMPALDLLAKHLGMYQDGLQLGSGLQIFIHVGER